MGAASYQVYHRNLTDNKSQYVREATLEESTKREIGGLVVAGGEFEFCVSALNGDYESGKSQCMHN